MDYLIVSTSKCKYQEWQIRVLAWSLKKVNQKGKLILLLSEDNAHSKEQTYFQFNNNIEIHNLPDWAHDWEKDNNDWWGGIPNKYESIKWLTENRKFNPDDRLLFLDPDMLFLEAINLYPKENEIIGQEWPKAYDDKKGFMYPFALQFKTLEVFIDTYKSECIRYRRETGNWIAEMWGLVSAAEKHNITVDYKQNLGRCTLWNDNNSSNLASIIHYPNPLESDEEKIFFKQDYTFNLEQIIEANKSRNFFDSMLLSNIDQERTNYRYYTDNDNVDLFKFYNGEDGYILYEKWPGGFNNIRMSFELVVCMAYILNRTLVIPPSESFYLLEGECHIGDFFELENLGIKYLDFDTFKKKEKLDREYKEFRFDCKLFDRKTDEVVYNFERVNPPDKFLKGRDFINMREEISKDDRYVYFHRNLLGHFYQILYCKEIDSLKELVRDNIRYKNKIFDIAWLFINTLKDKEYYAIHIRRNDFQYKELHISCEELYENIKDRIPEGSNLYIATDHPDKEFFNLLKDKYKVSFFEDVIKKFNYLEYDENWVPIFEQLICTRATRFIGTDLSTLSSYVYRLRGYMNDISDTSYGITTKKYDDNEILFELESSCNGGWVREYPNAWMIDNSKIFVSIASYCDGEIFNTLKNLYKNVSSNSRINVCVNLQDTQETYDRLLEFNYPNLNILFTKKEDALGVVVARNKIKKEITYEPYFLQVDSHSRFKKNWDLINIAQYNSIEEPKVILTAYPNEYHVPDEEENYLQLPFNAPLKIQNFLQPEDKYDNRSKATNYPSHEKYEPFKTQWCGAGYLFTRSEWTKEVQLPDNIVFSGEEDWQTHVSFLKGWNLRTCSEATVWHNYNYRVNKTNEPYREHNNEYLVQDNAVNLLNEQLFDIEHTRSVEELEDYLDISFKKPHTDKTIFVALTSFIDKDIRNTILSCVNQARHPENLYFGIVLQYDNNKGSNERCIDDLVKKYNIKIDKYYYKESKGGCWARNIVSNFYSGEDYSLQIDCHTRMIKHWDEKLITEFVELKHKGIISYLSPGFTHDENTGLDHSFHHIESRDILNKPTITEITQEYWPKFQGYTNEESTNGINREVSILYCGFIFGEGMWIKDIKNDPEHYYTGEEFMLSIRAYTKGYNIYQPKEAISWHRNNPEHKHHHGIFEDHDSRHKHAMERLRMLIEGEDLGEYGLGKERTLADYENLAGINLKQRRVYS